MPQFVLADVAVGPVIAIAGVVFGLITLFLIVLVEFLVLQALGWSLRKAFIDALLVNIASSLVGLLVIAWINLGLSGLVTAFLLSVLIEGALLQLQRRNPAQQAWKAAVLTNVASYLLIALFIRMIP